jgi:uncharacterized protein YhhL (DUF1145 family)
MDGIDIFVTKEQMKEYPKAWLKEKSSIILTGVMKLREFLTKLTLGLPRIEETPF